MTLIHTLIDLAVCYVALSCWKNKSSLSLGKQKEAKFLPGQPCTWLEQSHMVQSFWSSANLSLALLCFSLMEGFFLALHDFSPAPRSLSQIILTVQVTDVILWPGYLGPITDRRVYEAFYLLYSIIYLFHYSKL